MNDWLYQSILPTSEYLGYVFAVSFLVSISITTIFYLFYFRRNYDHLSGSDYIYFRILAPALIISAIGGLSGQLGGSSRESVVGEVVPALFTLAGAYGSYLLGAKRADSPLIIPNGLSFIFSFFILFNLSSVWRQENEISDFCLKLFSNPDFNTIELTQYRMDTFGDYCASLLSR